MEKITNIKKKKIVFVVVGRLGKSLTLSKLLPIVASGKFDKVMVFREEKGFDVPGVEYITLNFLMKVKSARLRKMIRYFIEPCQIVIYAVRLRPTLINGYQLLPKGIYSYFAARIAFTKCMISSIGGIPEIDSYSIHKWFWKNLNLFVLKHAEIVTTKGKTVTDYIVKHGVDKNKVFTYNGAIDTNRFFFDASVNKEIDLLFIGNLSELKGPDRFVLIIKEIINQFPDIKSFIIGDGPLIEQTKQMIEVFELKKNIELIGYTEETEVFFKRSKILVMPSRSEGLATAMIEAMSCGCVPVVSDVGCMNEAARHGETALLVKNYQDIDGFVKQISSILTNEKLREQISENAIRLIQKDYTTKAQAEIFKNIIKTKLEKV